MGDTFSKSLSIGRFAMLYNCAVGIQMHFLNTFKIELTTCMSKNELLKIHLLLQLNAQVSYFVLTIDI